MVPGKASTPEYAGLLERLLTEPAFRQQAQAFAQRHAAHTREGTAREVFGILQGMLSRAA